MVGEVKLVSRLLHRASQPAAVAEADDLLVRHPTPNVLVDASGPTTQLARRMDPGRFALEARCLPPGGRRELRQCVPQGARRAAGEQVQHSESVVAWLEAEAGPGSVGGQAVGQF